MATAFGEDAYPDLWSKAAALLHSLVNDHPLVDGNKRLGWLAAATFLHINGIEIRGTSEDDAFVLVMELAAGAMEVDELADRLRSVVDR